MRNIARFDQDGTFQVEEGRIYYDVKNRQATGVHVSLNEMTIDLCLSTKEVKLGYIDLNEKAIQQLSTELGEYRGGVPHKLEQTNICGQQAWEITVEQKEVQKLLAFCTQEGLLEQQEAEQFLRTVQHLAPGRQAAR